MNGLFFHLLGISSSQLTHIFQRGRYTTNQKHVQIFLQPSRPGKSWETAMRLYQAGQAQQKSALVLCHMVVQGNTGAPNKISKAYSHKMPYDSSQGASFFPQKKMVRRPQPLKLEIIPTPHPCAVDQVYIVGILKNVSNDSANQKLLAQRGAVHCHEV